MRDPRTQIVADGYEVIGQTFAACADFTELELPPASFDAVCSSYVFNHLPRELPAQPVGSIRGRLAAGGRLVEEPERPARFQWVVAQA